MEKPSSYCAYVASLEQDNAHRIYHDKQYGFPVTSDDELFGRLILEINQAGLSWTTILNKQEHFRNAYSNFNVKEVANYGTSEIERLLANSRIIRNILKINAAIHNAQKIVALQNEFGSFKNWLDQHHPHLTEEWLKLLKQTFKFTGGEITNEFLLSTGYLSGAHIKECEIYNTIIEKKPKWNENNQ
jgi:DNA-3-methyladenine glycosylase I